MVHTIRQFRMPTPSLRQHKHVTQKLDQRYLACLHVMYMPGKNHQHETLTRQTAKRPQTSKAHKHPKPLCIYCKQ